MTKRTGFSVIITKRGLILVGIVVLVVVLVIGGPLAYEQVNRRVNGVKPGVMLSGYPMVGYLEGELFDVVAALAERHYIDARNAVWDWETNSVQPEQIGNVIDIRQTVSNVLAAEAGESVDFASVEVLPSITEANFRPYYRGPTNTARMTLMINVDWGNEFIPQMLSTLDRFNITTTWFPTGRWVEKYPELAKTIAEAGHEIGNHGGWHGMASKMSREEVKRLIASGEEAIEAATGQKPVVFAPPGGDLNQQTVAVAAELGYKTVLWTIDTIDWQRPAATVIVDRVVSKAQNGALVLMHPTKPTMEALPLIIKKLLDENFQLVTVSQLLGQ